MSSPHRGAHWQSGRDINNNPYNVDRFPSLGQLGAPLENVAQTNRSQGRRPTLFERACRLGAHELDGIDGNEAADYWWIRMASVLTTMNCPPERMVEVASSSFF